MGQIKGNPTPSYQNQAYETLRPNDRTNRNLGTAPVMISHKTTLNEVVDTTFDTDVAAALVSGSINTTINSLSGSVSATYITSASMRNTLGSFIVFGGTGGGYANDGAAAAAGVPVGGLYHTAGAVKVRLT
jgi:hypothetical protein